MLQLLRAQIVLLLLLTTTSGEWFGITQQHNSQNSSKAPQINVLYNETVDLITPSPEWIAYQRERFGVEHDKIMQKHNVSQQVVVPVILKNTKPSTANIPTNHKIVPVKQNNTQKPHKDTYQMLTTPRKDMSYGPVEVEAEVTENADVDVDNADDDDDAEDYLHNPTDYDANGDNNNETGLEYPSLKGFLNFLKSIQRNWMKKSAFSIEKKINMLKRLRDKLMRIIEQQFTALWTPKEHQRRKRGILEESNLNFPPEAALISINFLTFAVFLIKLVLQVVHIIKSKHFSFSGFGITSDPLRKSTLRS